LCKLGTISRLKALSHSFVFIKIYSIPLNFAILSSIGGCVINNLENPFLTFGPNGLEIKRCAVALFACLI